MKLEEVVICWLRIDRYYSSESTFEGDNERKENIAGLGDSLSTFNEMEKLEIIHRFLSSQLCVNIVIMLLVRLFVQLLQLHIASRSKSYGL
jgi:hypothetical protein